MMRGLEAKHAVLLLLVLQNTFLVLLMRYSRTRPGTMYLGSTAVVCDEAMKLVACMGILLVSFWTEERRRGRGGSAAGAGDQTTKSPEAQSQAHQAATASDSTSTLTTTSFVEYLKLEVFSAPNEYLKMAGLALLYTIQKNLLYLAVSNLDAAVFQVTYQAKILTTAMFSVLLLRRRLSRGKVFALLVLAVGVALVQLDKVDENASQSHQTQRRWVGVLAVLGACCTSGFGGVYFEWVLKRDPAADEAKHYKPPSLWAKNAQLSSCALLIASIAALSKDGRAIRDGGFFQGYSPLVLSVVALEAFGGLVVAAVIKYADNILKSFAAAVSIVTSTIASIMIFGFTVSEMFLIGSLLVFTAIYLYSKEDETSKPSTPKNENDSKALLKDDELAENKENMESEKLLRRNKIAATEEV